MKAFCAKYTLLVCLILLTSVLQRAQDVQPRVYAPAPVGVNLFTLGYAYSAGSVLFDKTVPIDDVLAKIHSFSAVYSRSTELFGMAGRFDAALPFVKGNWTGNVVKKEESTSLTGIGDPILRFALFLAGAPALSKEKFACFKPKTIVGITLRIQLPLGQYDPNRIINLGSNRWMISPQIGLWHVFKNFTLEAYAGVWLFTDNKEFQGTKVKSQEPLYTFQVHVSYSFPNGIWIAASSRQSLGGAVKIDGGDRLDPETNNRLGFTIAIPVGSSYSLKFIATTGAAATVGNDYSTIAVAGQVVF